MHLAEKDTNSFRKYTIEPKTEQKKEACEKTLISLRCLISHIHFVYYWSLFDVSYIQYL